MRIARIDRDGTFDLRLCLLVSLIKDMDAAEDDARAHLGIVRLSALLAISSARLRNAVGDSAQPIDAAM